MRFRTLCILAIALSVILTGCIRVAQTIPEEGTFYCQELEITIDLNTRTGFAVVDGDKINCAFGNDHGSRFIGVTNQQPGLETYYLGESIFSGECIHFDEDSMVVLEEWTQIEYTFKRIDTVSPIEINWRSYSSDEYEWWDTKGNRHITPIGSEEFWDDQDLQHAIRSVQASFPLSSEEAITAFSWEIRPALMKCNYIPSNYTPLLASHCINGVWIITYVDADTHTPATRDGGVEVYLAEEDGHIIFVNYPELYSR